MQKTRIRILSTRPLGEAIVSEAADAGIDINVISFIDTEPAVTSYVQERIKDLTDEKATAIFTSMNAVDVVADLLTQSPAWNIGSIGTTTRHLIEQKLPASSIIATGNNASELAEALAASRPSGQVVFFCGNQRRDELPVILREHGIELEELVVYNTITTSVVIEEQYDGIAFYSPSAVESFFSANKPPADSIMFAIGATTANALGQQCSNKIVVSDNPGKNNLVKTIIDFYTSTTERVNRTI